MATRLWGSYTLEMRTEFGTAARRNRGRYAGHKVHRLISEYIVAVDNPEAERVGTLGQRFIKTGQPVLFSCSPACGCTQGQHAGQPIEGKSEADVTCAKCHDGIVLKHGQDYNLGATTGTWDAKQQVFHLGNCFVPKGNTGWANNRSEPPPT